MKAATSGSTGTLTNELSPLLGSGLPSLGAPSLALGSLTPAKSMGDATGAGGGKRTSSVTAFGRGKFIL